VAKIKMGLLSDLPPGKMIEKRIIARRIAVVNDNNRIYAIEADCKHMKASLTTGRVDDGTITCRWHGWKYDLASGVCLTNKNFKIKTFRTETKDGFIFIIT